MSRTRSWTHEVLLSAARLAGGPVAPPPAGQTWEGLALAARAHGVQGWLARRLRRAEGVPADFQIRLQGAAARIAGNHRKMLAVAAHALSVLDGAGVGALVLKGPALVERYYADPTLRAYGDIDLLVRPADFGSALGALERAGYALTDRNWDFLVRDLRGQVHLTGRDGAVVELHWHLVNGSRQRRTLQMSPEEIWDAAIEARLGDVACLVLAREDEIAHLALHAAMHGCNRLVWLLDIAAALDGAQAPDWDRIVARLRRWRFATGGGIVLALATEWAGAPVPRSVLDALVPGRAARAGYRRTVEGWDLADAGSRARELMFVVAGDGLSTRAALAADAIVPAPGQQPDAAARGAVYRASVGTIQRVRTKVFHRASGEELAEYVEVGDQEEGRARFVAAVGATVAGPDARRIVLVSPSRSIGMSHYTRALARALGESAGVEVIDAATGDGATAVVARWWTSRRRDRGATRVLVTSPHWSIPLLLRLTGWKGGFVWHDPILDAATPRTRPLHRLYYRLLTRRLGVVVLHGTTFTRRVTELGLRSREVLVAPHGFVPDQLVATERYDPEGPFVFAGRLHAYKGLGVLLDALALEASAAPSVVVAGDGVRRDLIPRSLTSVEVRPGELPDHEFRALIGRSSAVLLPYERANQSGVLATAFRSGRPVIASRVGSFEEYVRDGVNGLLVPPGDAAALADAMRRLRSDPELARRLAAGAATSWEEELSPARWGAEITAALFR
ncbi:MAG: nucleotidyltransferase family protein [Actinomycetota bacterium]